MSESFGPLMADRDKTLALLSFVVLVPSSLPSQTLPFGADLLSWREQDSLLTAEALERELRAHGSCNKCHRLTPNFSSRPPPPS